MFGLTDGFFSSLCTDVLLPLAQTPAPSGQAAPDPFKFFLPMMAILAFLFWFIVMKPQRDEQKKKQQAVDTVGKGDQIVTSGGIHGTVEAVDVSKNIITVLIAPKTTIRIEKWALQTIVKSKGAAKEEKETAGSEKA